ncbi:MAG: hypothetical protein ACRELB_05925, partial [Polyangiaceae bacterium]
TGDDRGMNRFTRAGVDRRVKLSLVTAVAFLGAVAACTGSSSNGASGFVQKYCSLLTPCCAAAGLPSSGQGCDQLGSAASAKPGYDDAKAQECLSGMQAEQAAGTLCSTIGDDIPACNQVFPPTSGSTPPGGTCQTDQDCAAASGGGATCYTNFSFGDGGSSQTQTCIQTQPGQAGDGPCIGDKQGTSTIYEWGGSGSPPTLAYLCDPSSGTTCDLTTQKCLALAATGASCTSDSACVGDDYCAYVSGVAQCTPRLPDGSSCAQASNACLTTSTCDATSSTCIPLLANGSACATSGQCQSGSCDNQKCSDIGAAFGLAIICGGL